MCHRPGLGPMPRHIRRRGGPVTWPDIKPRLGIVRNRGPTAATRPGAGYLSDKLSVTLWGYYPHKVTSSEHRDDPRETPRRFPPPRRLPDLPARLFPGDTASRGASGPQRPDP